MIPYLCMFACGFRPNLKVSILDALFWNLYMTSVTSIIVCGEQCMQCMKVARIVNTQFSDPVKAYIPHSIIGLADNQEESLGRLTSQVLVVFCTSRK